MTIDIHLLLRAKVENLIRLAESLEISWENKTRLQLAQAVEKEINSK